MTPVPDGYTVSLLHFDGSDGSSVFTDESGKTWTNNDNAQIDTAQSKFGGACGLFDGVNDYVSTPHHSDFNITNADFTIDFWAKLSTLAHDHHFLSKAPAGGSLCEYELSIGAGQFFFRWGYNSIYTQNMSSYMLSGLTSIFNHFAVVRSVNTMMLFFNGVLTQSYNMDVNTQNVYQSNNVVYLGKSGRNSVYGHLEGWIDELRVSKGVARWTSNFTPPDFQYVNSPAFSQKIIMIGE